MPVRKSERDINFGWISHLIDRYVDEISEPGKCPGTVIIVLHGRGHCQWSYKSNKYARTHHPSRWRYQRVPLEDTVPLRSVALSRGNMIVRTQRLNYGGDAMTPSTTVPEMQRRYVPRRLAALPAFRAVSTGSIINCTWCAGL